VGKGREKATYRKCTKAKEESSESPGDSGFRRKKREGESGGSTAFNRGLTVGKMRGSFQEKDRSKNASTMNGAGEDIKGKDEKKEGNLGITSSSSRSQLGTYDRGG